MRFGDLTYREIRERAEASWLAVVPTGCTEQQGPHLPVDFDTWFAETLCLAAARQAPRSCDDPHLDFAHYSSTGVIGDPTHASAELGARLWHAIVENVALTFKEIAEKDLT